MNVEAENAVMRERARIREEVVRLNEVDGILEHDIKQRKDVVYVPLAAVLKILNIENIWDRPVVEQLSDKHLMQAVEKALSESKWLIWSNEHNSWWAPYERGYTRSRFKAGRYSYKRALEIVKNANCRNGDRPMEAMVEDVDDDLVAKELGRA